MDGKRAAAAAKAHYASCCVMVFHVVGFSCFSLKIGEMEIFHKTNSSQLNSGSRGGRDVMGCGWRETERVGIHIKFSACTQQLKLKIWADGFLGRRAGFEPSDKSYDAVWKNTSMFKISTWQGFKPWKLYFNYFTWSFKLISQQLWSIVC